MLMKYQEKKKLNLELLPLQGSGASLSDVHCPRGALAQEDPLKTLGLYVCIYPEQMLYMAGLLGWVVWGCGGLDALSTCCCNKSH